MVWMEFMISVAACYSQKVYIYPFFIDQLLLYPNSRVSLIGMFTDRFTGFEFMYRGKKISKHVFKSVFQNFDLFISFALLFSFFYCSTYRNLFCWKSLAGN